MSDRKDVKGIYTIFDVVGGSFGDLVPFANEDEAKRFYVNSLAQVSPEMAKDLYLYEIGSVTYPQKNITDENGKDLFVPPVFCSCVPHIISNYEEVKASVEGLIEYNAKLRAMHEEFAKIYSDKKLHEDVTKIHMYAMNLDSKKRKFK